jgi:hypothetical protein
MITDFQFFGFNPTDELKTKAIRALDRLLDIAPYGSMAVALMRKDEDMYCCSIEIFSKRGPFVARVSQKTPEASLEKSARMLSKKLERWHESVRSPALQPRFSS